MSVKEKFCKYSKHKCPDCDSKMKIMDIIDDEGGVSYTAKHEVCDECGYEHDITDKRDKNNKVEIVEPIIPEKPWKDKDKSRFNRR